MEKTSKKPISVEAIARLADKGENVSFFFMNQGQMIDPLLEEGAVKQRVVEAPAFRPMTRKSKCEGL